METVTNVITAIEWHTFIPTGINVLKAIGILILGFMIARWVERLVRKRLGNDKGLQVDDTLRPLLATIVRYTIIFAAVYAALTTAGIPAASLLAVFGAAGLAIALAVQGTLSNVAAGIMLIFLRAIRVGEYIETSSFGGNVLEIGLFTTEIKTSDGLLITVPNAQIWSGQIKNYSRFKSRRMDINIEIARDNDLGAAVAVLETAVSNFDAVINKSAASVMVSGFTPTSANLLARCWLKSENLAVDSSALRVHLHDTLNKKGFKLPPSLILK